MTGRDSVVRVATCYGLDVPGIESREGEFSVPVHPGPGPPILLYSGYPVVPGGKAAGTCRYSPSSTTEVNERVELYFYSRSVPS